MKKIYMTALLSVWLFSVPALASQGTDNEADMGFSRATGGPDAYGYTWIDSNEPGGPVFNWIDIATIGTEVTGLGDDNSVAMIPMGLTFQYYWIDFSEIKIGSNGWLSFDDVSNIASCFPALPTPGGAGDNIVAPYMSDLIFVGAGNPAKVYYYLDTLTNSFIVSYVDVPYWTASAPGYIGSNTFQVIFSADDSKITFQYLVTDTAGIPGSCATDLGIGIENTTGNIGLQVFNNTAPGNNFALDFIYPKVPLIDVIDPAPLWTQNPENAANFYVAGEDIALVSRINNSGNADTTSVIDVEIEVFDANNMSVYSDTHQLASLLAQEFVDISWPTQLNLTAGEYRVEVSTDSSSDINPANNMLSTELDVVDTSVSPYRLSYSNNLIQDSSQSWTGGTGGVGVFMQPPTDNWKIKSVTMFVTPSVAGSADYTVAVYAADGVDGSPGTLLGSELVAEGSYTPSTFVETQLSMPIEVSSNGFYVAWETDGATDVAIGESLTAPISRRSYELLGGQWATFRENTLSDPMISAEMIDLIFADGFE
ncbi:MAG: hypothetical protein ACSHWU_02505 [Marinicella sp.]